MLLKIGKSLVLFAHVRLVLPPESLLSIEYSDGTKRRETHPHLKIACVWKTIAVVPDFLLD